MGFSKTVNNILEGEGSGPVIESLNQVERSDWKPERDELFFDMVDDKEFDELGEVYRAVRNGDKHNRLLGLKLFGAGVDREELSKALGTDVSGWMKNYRETGLWNGELTDRGKRLLQDTEELKQDLGSDRWKAEKSTIDYLSALDFSGDLNNRVYREVLDDTQTEKGVPGDRSDKYLGNVFKALSGDRLKVFCHYAGHESGYSHRSLGNFLDRSPSMIENAMESFYDLNLMYRTGDELTFMGEQVFEMIQRHYEALDDEGF